MIKNLKSIFLLILCAAVFGTATLNISAQTRGKVLVSAKGKTLKQSDVDTLIKFYEWAFMAEFSQAQRREFQNHTEQEFRANPAESRATIDDIVKTLPQILAASDEVQTETRQNFLGAFLPDLYNGTDANSQLLLSIYKSNSDEPPPPAPVVKKSDEQTEEDRYGTYETVKKVPVGNFSSIVGKWVSGNSGSIVTTPTGAILGGNGSRFTYQFNADGTVEHTGIMNSMTGGCRMQIFRSAKGKATLSGDTLTINWSPASFSRDDSCSPSKNYKKTLPAETETMKINFETFYDDKQLCLTTSDRMCYSRD